MDLHDQTHKHKHHYIRCDWMLKRYKRNAQKELYKRGEISGDSFDIKRPLIFVLLPLSCPSSPPSSSSPTYHHYCLILLGVETQIIKI